MRLIMNEIENIEEFRKVLKEMKFTDKEIESIIKLLNEKNYLEMISKLNKRRRFILNTIHQEESQISKLDYLIFEIQKVGGIEYGI